MEPIELPIYCILHTNFNWSDHTILNKRSKLEKLNRLQNFNAFWLVLPKQQTFIQIRMLQKAKRISVTWMKNRRRHLVCKYLNNISIYLLSKDKNKYSPYQKNTFSIIEITATTFKMHIVHWQWKSIQSWLSTPRGRRRGSFCWFLEA